MNNLQKEIAGYLLSDAQHDRVLFNKILPLIAETIASVNSLDGTEDIEEAYAEIVELAINYFIVSEKDSNELAAHKMDILESLKEQVEESIKTSEYRKRV